MTPAKPTARPRCPACGASMVALHHRTGPKGIFEPYRDPRDGAELHACKVHGRAAVKDGEILLEAEG